MSVKQRQWGAALLTALVAPAAASSNVLAEKEHDAGATDAGIKIGNIMPYSGPASAYGFIGKKQPISR
jgi:branched-chain amino acid transport system substrate-binding protein